MYTLGDLIERLESEPNDRVVEKGFGNPHSYRGYYEQLAFEPEKNTTVGEMLEHAKGSVGRTFTGYKGGKFEMDKHTQVWIAEYGRVGQKIGDILNDEDDLFNQPEGSGDNERD